MRRAIVRLLWGALLLVFGFGAGIAGVLVYDDLRTARFVQQHEQFAELWQIVGQTRPNSDNNYTADVTKAVCARFDSDRLADDWAKIPAGLLPRVDVKNETTVWRFVHRNAYSWLEWSRVLEIEKARNSGKCRAAVLYSSLI